MLASLLLAVSAASADEVTLFRVFLKDGTAVVSYGEYARVGDRVVFSMPIGAVSPGVSPPRLHPVNLPAAAVNWTATTEYAQSARFAHYVATTAEDDYAALTGEVASVLNSVMFAKDARARLDLAMQARQRLASWPREHYGYRADDVRQVLGMLDEAIAELRAAAGETAFSIDLLAETAPPPAVPILPVPTAAESILQAAAVARASDVPADRLTLLGAVVAAIEDPASGPATAGTQTIRRWALSEIKTERRTDAAYARLVSGSVRKAEAAAERGDVRTVEGTLANIDRRDVSLGRRRPDVIRGLVAGIRVRLDAARRLRLARDRWNERAGAFRAYQHAVEPMLALLGRAQPGLDDIKRLAGGDAVTLQELADRLSETAKRLAVLAVPDELKEAHGLLLSATSLAQTAVSRRRQAVLAGAMSAAWTASSAAAGSMMLLARAREEMEAATKLPQLR